MLLLNTAFVACLLHNAAAAVWICCTTLLLPVLSATSAVCRQTLLMQSGFVAGSWCCCTFTALLDAPAVSCLFYILFLLHQDAAQSCCSCCDLCASCHAVGYCCKVLLWLPHIWLHAVAVSAHHCDCGSYTLHGLLQCCLCCLHFVGIAATMSCLCCNNMLLHAWS